MAVIAPTQDGRIVVPNAVWMRRTWKPRTWHLGPAAAGRESRSLCNELGPWILIQRSVSATADLCPNCLAATGHEINKDFPNDG